MNQRQAMKEAKRRWGDKACLRDTKRPSSAEEREEANARLQEARAALKEATPENRKERRAALDKELTIALRYRYSVGYVGGIPAMGIAFFSIQGQGDTWEEAFKQADSRR
jgi:predicted RNase H-like HicB family nuclease